MDRAVRWYLPDVPDLADAAGRAVAVLIAAITGIRGAKPMHPRGVVFDAVAERTGPHRPWGLGWIDERTVDRVVVRLSKGAGFPDDWPDLLGLAIRFLEPPGGPPVDLLLSSTGRGRLTRMLPVVRRDAAGAYCSIMSYRSPLGRVQFAALPDRSSVPSGPRRLSGDVAGSGFRFTLVASLGGGDWEPIARVRLLATTGPLDHELPVDAVRHPPPGLVADGPMARFRRPAYAAARRARGLAG